VFAGGFELPAELLRQAAPLVFREHGQETQD
jgi:hypothetical protein